MIRLKNKWQLRKERKRKFNEELDRDIKLLIDYGYVKIDPTAKKPKYKEFETKMKEWGFINHDKNEK